MWEETKRSQKPGANWQGKQCMVTGHWGGNFVGTMKYAGTGLAIVVDDRGQEREICYLRPVEFALVKELKVKGATNGC